MHKGRIWDVAVDIRKGSPWYLKWVGIELSEENRDMLWIPPGFLHGFVALIAQGPKEDLDEQREEND